MADHFASFGTRGEAAPVFWSKKIILVKRRGNCIKQKLLERIQVTVWSHTDFFLLVLQKRQRALKPFLGDQNWVTSTGGHHNLVPRLTTERRVRPYILHRSIFYIYSILYGSMRSMFHICIKYVLRGSMFYIYSIYSMVQCSKSTMYTYSMV